MGNLTGPFYKHNFITSKVLNLKTLLSSSRFPIEKCEVLLERHRGCLKQTSRFLSFKVLNFVSLKLGKSFFKFRTLEVMKLRGVYREKGQ